MKRYSLIILRNASFHYSLFLRMRTTHRGCSNQHAGANGIRNGCADRIANTDCKSGAYPNAYIQ